MAIAGRTSGMFGIGRLRRLGERRGVAAVEFAIIAPVLVLLLIGACDVAFMFCRQTQVDAAAYAGTTYATKYGWNTGTQASSQESQTNIQTAAQVATSLGNSVSATATLTPGCLDTTTGALYTSSNPKCTGNVTAGTYVTVTTSYAFSALAPYSGLTFPSTLTGAATVRIN